MSDKREWQTIKDYEDIFFDYFRRNREDYH